MSIGQLQNLLRAFRGEKSTGDDNGTLLEELFVILLSRATSADTNIAPSEIETVQRVYKEVFGNEIETSVIRTAAKSEIFEQTPLESYVKAAGKKLSSNDKQLICRSMLKVMAADERHSPMEIDFFNTMVKALDMTPAEIAGFVSVDGSQPE